ncbi:MAG: hypothetical protein ACK504_06555 [Bacteroidota bacterium]
MKKSITLLALAVTTSSAFAQDLTSKKGEPILPEAGDYAIGINANPFFNYLGNFFGKTAANTAPTFNFLNGNNLIVGKYFKDASTAYRVGIRIGINNQSQKNSLDDVTETGVVYPNLPTQKEDKWTNNQTNVGLLVGIEKRKGKTRLQGFYGADFAIFASSINDKYTYGQKVDGTTTNLVAVTGANTSSFNSNANFTNANIGVVGQTSGRVTSNKAGNGLGFGLRAFVGAEYFVLPKISIGGEFGWGVGYTTGGKTTTTVESIGGTPVVNTTKEKTTKNGGQFILDTDVNGSSTGTILAPSGSLRINFHF